MAGPLMPLDAPAEWPQIGRGGHLRNAKGQALVVPPRGGRHRIYRGGSGLDVFYTYDGPSIYAEQGSHIHTATEWADAGKPLDAELIAAGEAVGVPGDRTRHAYDSYLEFVARLGWTTRLTECVIVNDEHMVASNIDKVMETEDGRWVVVDVKSGNSHDHRAYAMQLATYVGSRLYDPTAGKRKAWHRDIVQHAAFIFWYPVRAENPEWQRVVVRTDVGLDLLRRFTELAGCQKHLDAFLVVPPGAQVAAPADPPAVVEQPDGSDQPAAAASLPSTLDELRALVAEWPAIDRQELGDMMTRESVDRTDPEQVAKAIERYTFADIVAPAKAPRTPVERPERPVLPEPTEGPEIDAETADTVKSRYDRLDPAGKAWIGGIAAEANRAGTPFHMKEQRTARRFDITRGLVVLAAAEFDNDDALRGCLVPAIGDELADAMTFTHGQLVGCLDHNAAAVFAEHAVALAEGEAAMKFLDTGRCRVTRGVAA